MGNLIIAKSSMLVTHSLFCIELPFLFLQSSEAELCKEIPSDGAYGILITPISHGFCLAKPSSMKWRKLGRCIRISNGKSSLLGKLDHNFDVFDLFLM